MVDGKLVELPPRRAELMRKLLKAGLELDTMEVGRIEFRVAQDRVTMYVTKGEAPSRVLSWWAWMKTQAARSSSS
jgi:hypothetical protein